jgi:hypothetical protein
VSGAALRVCVCAGDSRRGLTVSCSAAFVLRVRIAAKVGRWRYGCCHVPVGSLVDRCAFVSCPRARLTDAYCAATLLCSVL